MLDDLDETRFRELVLFDRLVALGTITAAARELRLPKATAGRWLALLEQRMGHSLLLRGTRQVVLTPRGQALHQLLPALLGGMRAMRAVAQEGQPGGTLRVSVPVPFGPLVAGAVIARFQRQLPQVRLEIMLQNGRVDLLRERLDLAIRGGPMPESELVARRLADVLLWLYVSPAHKDARLCSIPLIAAPGDEERLAVSHEELLPAAVVVDDRTAVRDALLAGAGAGVLPAFLGEPERAQGRLVRLAAEAVSAIAVHAVFLPEQRADPRIRTLVEIIEAEMRPWAA